MNTETIDYDKLAAAIADRLAPSVPLEDAIWTADQIAAYLHVSKRQVTERYAPLPSFPRAIRLPVSSGDTKRPHPRWKAREIIEWAGKHQEKRRAA